VDFALKQNLVEIIEKIKEVSILVLVDFALKRMDIQSAKSHNFCFNPCFGGFCSKTAIDPNLSQQPTSFNPCFGGFCSKTGCIHWLGGCVVSNCFNPCFGGFCSKTLQM